MTIYEENGHANRSAYLKSVAEDFGLPLRIVCTAAHMLGENEDFDGLLTTLEDYAEENDA